MGSHGNHIKCVQQHGGKPVGVRTYPSDPFQPGPMYFLTPRKCAIFGVCCEALPWQVNYLIDEASDTGKGANTIISLLHHFFQEHGLGETDVHLHADNCVGQNKNSTMLHYLLWRVMVGLHRSITLSFLIVGHTKFSPDWCFGLLKQRFRRTVVGCLDELVQVVNTSATVNVAQLVGSQEGETIVPIYDWMAMFAENIKHYQHFRFASSSPGAVTVQLASDTEEESIVVLADWDWVPSSHLLPPVTPPPVVCPMKGRCTCTTRYGSTAPMKSVIVCAQGLSLLTQPPTLPLPRLPQAFRHPPLQAHHQQRSCVCVEAAGSPATPQGPAARGGVASDCILSTGFSKCHLFFSFFSTGFFKATFSPFNRLF